MRLILTAVVALVLGAGPVFAADGTVTESHALSLLGEPKYGPDFEHTDYVNPDAPKGGHVRMHTIGKFDSLNPFITAGSPAGLMGLGIETLMKSPLDETSSEYGLIAESVRVPDDDSWAEFTLREQARWHDGAPITVEDVIFSYNTLVKSEAAQPFYAFYYRNVVEVEKTGPRSVKFTFDQSGNRELPQIMGQLPVLSKAHWQARDFSEPSLEPFLMSGPYKVGEVKPGRSITLERVEDYWGKDLPLNVGHYNFDKITLEYFLDGSVSLEAFKAREYDFRMENTAKLWATEYDFPARRDGHVKVQEIAHELPTGMQAFAFNIRREMFQDRRVREALSNAFDFEWTNRTLLYDQYARTKSYFSNTELAARQLPSDEELELLEPFKDQLPPGTLTQVYEPPETDGGGNNRDNLRKAAMLLREAGWRVKDGVLTHEETGRELEFEILLSNPAFERLTQPFIRNLERLGVKAEIRLVDSGQYQRRIDTGDFDMYVANFGQSISPGNEQRDFWGSEAADRVGSRNRIGIKDPVIDALIDKVIFAEDRAALITATRALDRVLLHHHFVIPQWHYRKFRLAYWDRFDRPASLPPYHHGFPHIWWIDAEKDARIKALGRR